MTANIITINLKLALVKEEEGGGGRCSTLPNPERVYSYWRQPCMLNRFISTSIKLDKDQNDFSCKSVVVLVDFRSGLKSWMR